VGRLRVLGGDFDSGRPGSYFLGTISLRTRDGRRVAYDIRKNVRSLDKRDHKWLASAAKETAVNLAALGLLNVFRVGQHWNFGRVTFEAKFDDGRRLISSASGRLWLSMREVFRERVE